MKNNTVDKQPIVSVIMGLYDGDKPEWLKSSIDSILSQTYSNFEFIVVLDGVKKAVLSQIVANYALRDSRIRIVRLPVNMGLARVLNSAISISQGEFIVRMDADDISPPERIECLVKFMLLNPDVDVAGSYTLEFSDEHDISVGHIVKYPYVHEEMRSCMLRRNPLAHPSAIFRPNFFEKAGSYPLFSIRNEDTLHWLNGFKAGCRFANLPKVLYFVRYDSTNSGRRAGFRKSFSDFIDRTRVIIDLGGTLSDYIAALVMLIIQNMPRSVHLAIRSTLIYRTNS